MLCPRSFLTNSNACMNPAPVPARSSPRSPKKGKGPKDKSADKAKKQCTHCKFRGHNVKECRKKKKEKEKAKEAKGGTTESPPKPAPAMTTKVAVANLSDEIVHLFRAATAKRSPCDNVTFALRVHPTEVNQHWIINSGASCTISCNHELFYSFTTLTCPIQVTLGDNSFISATGISRIVIVGCAMAQSC